MRRFPLGPAVVLFTLVALPMPAAPAAAAEPTPTAAAVPAPPAPENELRQGREAYAHGDYASAATHLARAAAGFQAIGDRESLAASYLELGRVELVGLGEPEKALAAFLQSAERAARPADALLWAATAADKLGLPAEARRYRERAQEPAKLPAPHKPRPYRDKELAAAAQPTDPKPAPAPAPPAAAPAAQAALRAPADEHPEMATFYLVLLRRSPAWTPEQTPEVQRLQEAHMAHIRRLAAEGKLVIAGPFLEQTGKGSLAGLYIFRSPSLDAAKELASTDPMVRSGRLVPEIYPWLGPKGLHY